MRRETKRPTETKRPKVRTFYGSNLFTVSYQGASSAPYLCIEVDENHERGLTIDLAWDELHFVRMLRLDDGRDFIEDQVPLTTNVRVASVFLAGHDMTDMTPMIEIMTALNSDSDDESDDLELKKFFEEVEIYLKEIE